MPKPVSNPPNPFKSTFVEWIDAPPMADLEVYEEHAKTVLSSNDSPDVGFTWSLNPYRGCFNGCAYCLDGDTPILMLDGTTRPLEDLRAGDAIVGTEDRGKYRWYVATKVLAHWRTLKRAFRVTLADGTELVASADHRFLTKRGWKYVTGSECGRARRPHLTMNVELMGSGRFFHQPIETAEYKRGYLCGMIRGDGHIHPKGRGEWDKRAASFRLALVDSEPLQRVANYLLEAGISTKEFLFMEAFENRKRLMAIRCGGRSNIDLIHDLIQWPVAPSNDWRKGFLAGLFDAEGSFSKSILRFSNTDPTIIYYVASSLRVLGFDAVVEGRPKGIGNRTAQVRIRKGLHEQLRFFHTVGPCIARKKAIVGTALKSNSDRRVVRIEDTGLTIPMYDITTGTGDFIANGVVSHNCYARPTHQYWDFDAGTDFERKIVVKVNAPEVLREHFMKKSWKGELIAFSGNTDCYQPLEASYELTRRCLQVCAEFRNPVGVITKGAIIRRDIDVLQSLHRDAKVNVNMSIAFADDEMARKIEPYAPSPSTRLKALEALAKAGIPVGVGVAPIIPGLNDSQVAEILTRARDAGATRAFRVMLRLPAEVKPVFLGRLQEAYPDRAKKVVGGIRDMRGGALYRNGFGVRGQGQGPRWEAVEALFDLTCKRLGLNADDEEPRDVHEYRGGPREIDARETEEETTFRRPGDQLSLFGK